MLPTSPSGPMLRKTGGTNVLQASLRKQKKRSEDGEKSSKIQRQQESRTKNAMVFLGIFSLIFVVAMVKLRHNHAVKSVTREASSLRSLRNANRRAEESVALEEVTRGEQHAAFIPPHSIYSLSVEDITGSMVSLEKFHGLVTLVVNVACL